MGLAESVALRRTGAAGAPCVSAPFLAAVVFHYAQTESLAVLLRQLVTSLLVSAYQANKLLVVRAARAGYRHPHSQ